MTADVVKEGYWYGNETVAVEVLNALRDYRSAEAAMRRRTRSSMGMGETDLLALRYLLEYERAGRMVGPKELATRLGITSASMTSLVDRMVKSGHVVREPHPTDRRALVLRPTSDSDEEVRKTQRHAPANDGRRGVPQSWRGRGGGRLPEANAGSDRWD